MSLEQAMLVNTNREKALAVLAKFDGRQPLPTRTQGVVPMSLEQAIKENTEALRALIAIHQNVSNGVQQLRRLSDAQSEAATEIVSEKKDAPKAETVTPPPTATVEAGAAVEQKAAPSVAFDALKAPFLALVNTNREKALAVLAKFGLTKLSEAKPEQYGELFAAVQGA